MTRKDYVLIAEAIRKVYSDHHPDDCFGVDWTARAIADALSRDKPRFDRTRFLEACGVAS